MGVTLLLDTHALLWALTDPDKLSAEARTRVEDPSTTLLVSTASTWEVATKYRPGKLTEAGAIVHALDQHLARLALRCCPSTSSTHSWPAAWSIPTATRSTG